MTAEIIEGHAVEIVPEIRAVAVVQQPGQVIVSDDATDMVAVASRLATVLADIVERQRLFAVIQGKKYPTVEAWMTIARLDNVVAREPRPPIRHDDGSYEAFAELIRLSDGMPIGAASALCGTPDDKPWSGRSEPNRRSMAQTRATSRAFRQQYSWIMALAGYEPTPADEMPPEAPVRGITRDTAGAADGGITGRIVVKADKRSQDFELRQTPDGMALGFRLEYDGTGVIVECVGALADQLAFVRAVALEAPVTVYGTREPRSFDDKKTDPPRKVTYEVLRAERIRVDGVDLPRAEAASQPMFDEAAQRAEIDGLVW